MLSNLPVQRDEVSVALLFDMLSNLPVLLRCPTMLSTVTLISRRYDSKGIPLRARQQGSLPQ